MKSKLLLLTFVLPFISLAQKVDLDRFNFTASFRSLPVVKLDSSYRTYDLSTESTRLMQNYMADLAPEKYLRIQGWKMLPSGAHLSIKIRFEDLLPESFATRERVEPIKDRTGKQIGVRTTYYQEVIYTLAATGEVVDYKGEHVFDMVLADRSAKQMYRSPEFQVRQVAEGYFMINALKITGDLFRNNARNAIGRISSRLNYNYGFENVTVNDFMWILGNRKHPEYDAHRNAFLTIKEVMFGLSPDKPLTGVREKLQPVIKYFESIKKNYSSSSKADRKLRYASYFNLAVIYYYLDDPQAMMKEASGLILNDFDARDGRAFENTALQLKQVFENSGYTTRHFPIDVNSFKGPNEKTQTVVTY